MLLFHARKAPVSRRLDRARNPRAAHGSRGVGGRAARRGLAAVGAGALLLGVSAPAAFAVADEATTREVPTYTEKHTFSPDAPPGGTPGNASDVVGDTVAYTSDRGAIRQSVMVAVSIDGQDDAWQTTELTPPDPGANTVGFGVSVAVASDEQTVYVSSPREERVYGFPRGDGDWAGEPRVYDAPAPPDRVAHAAKGYLRSFAENIAVSDSSLILGVANAEVDGLPNVGMAWHLDLASGSWRPLLPAAGGAIDGGILGQSVAVEGRLAAAGAVQVRSPSNPRERIGGVYLWNIETSDDPLFTSQPATGPDECAPVASGGGAAFGMSIAIVDRLLYVGSPIEGRHDEGAACTNADVSAGRASQGAIYRLDETLAQVGPKLAPPNGRTDFGYSLAVTGSALLAHANSIEPGATGAVLVYDTSDLMMGGPVGAEIVTPEQSLVPENYAGTAFGTQLYGDGISADGGRALIIDRDSDSYLFAPLIPNIARPTLSLEDSEHTYGQSDELTATLSVPAAAGYADSVDFFVAGEAAGSAQLTDGVASLETEAAAFDAASDGVEVTATLELRAPEDAQPGAADLSADAMLTVLPAETATEITAASALDDGSGWQITGRTTAEYGTEPTGAILLDGAGSTVPTALSARAFAAFVPAVLPTATGDTSPDVVTSASPAAPPVKLSASYEGDGNHLPSGALTELPVLPVVDPPVIDPPVIDPPTGAKTADLEATGGELNPLITVGAAALLLIAGVAAVAAARLRFSRQDR